MYIPSLCRVDYSVETIRRNVFMKKAGTGKIRRIKEDTLIVTIDIGLESCRSTSICRRAIGMVGRLCSLSAAKAMH